MEKKLEFIITYGKEVVIMMLNKYYNILKEENRYTNEEKEAAKKFYEEYLKLYFKIDIILLEDIEKMNEEINEINIIINKIIELETIDIKDIENKINLRLKNKEKNGSEVVKKLFKYQLKEFTKSLEMLKNKYSKLILEENLLKEDFDKAVQEDESRLKMELLIKKGKIIQEIDKKINVIEIKIAETERKLKEKWHYEIYGIVSEEELKKSLK